MIRVGHFLVLAPLLTVLMLSTVAHAKKIQLFSGGLSFANAEVTGSGYKSSSQSNVNLAGQYDYFFSAKWRLQISANGNFQGDYLMAAAGASYHFRPLAVDVQFPQDNIDYQVFNNWSPYVGVDLSFSRVQLTLDRIGSDQTDAVIGALTGPVLRAGSFYSLSPDWLFKGDFSVTYAFSPQVASTSQNFTFYLCYLIP